jgi:hypothetical protein
MHETEEWLLTMQPVQFWYSVPSSVVCCNNINMVNWLLYVPPCLASKALYYACILHLWLLHESENKQRLFPF